MVLGVPILKHFWVFLLSELISEGYLTVNPERVDVNLGERVEVNCSVHNISRPFMLRWDKYLNNSKFKVRLNIKTPHVKTYSPSDNTRLLVMNSVRVEDEGTYTCVAVHANGQALKKEIEIKIKMGKSLSLCICISSKKIPEKYFFFQN